MVVNHYCEKCDYITTKSCNYKRHLKSKKHLGIKKQTIHKCVKCNYQTKYTTHFRQHLQCHIKGTTYHDKKQIIKGKITRGIKLIKRIRKKQNIIERLKFIQIQKYEKRLNEYNIYNDKILKLKNKVKKHIENFDKLNNKKPLKKSLHEHEILLKKYKENSKIMKNKNKKNILKIEKMSKVMVVLKKDKTNIKTLYKRIYKLLSFENEIDFDFRKYTEKQIRDQKISAIDKIIKIYEDHNKNITDIIDDDDFVEYQNNKYQNFRFIFRELKKYIIENKDDFFDEFSY
jgi:hypothetical protein